MQYDSNDILIYKASDESGFVVYDKYSGETKFIKSFDALNQQYPNINKSDINMLSADE